jgi:catechol 2,3-dioxygenase-like lactoylglutathione lyase family enzyme
MTMSLAKVAVLCLVAFGLGAAADHEYRIIRGPHGPYAQIAHVGILTPNLDLTIQKLKALGFTGIEMSPPDSTSATYRGHSIEVPLKKAWIHGTVPPIELMQPSDNTPNPWSSELTEHGEVLHHIAFAEPDEAAAITAAQGVGMLPMAAGRWAGSATEWFTWDYVRDPSGALILEFLSRTARK